MKTSSGREKRQPWEDLFDSHHLSHDISKLFDDDIITTLTSLMGEKSKPWAIRKGLDVVVRDYLWSRFFATRRAPGEMEWKRIVRFKQAADNFARELNGLMENGNADQRLLIDFHDRAANSKEPEFESFLHLSNEGGPNSPLVQLQYMVSSLSDAAERLTNEATLPEGASIEQRSSAYLDKIMWLAKPADKRGAESFCIDQAIKSFVRVWKMNSYKRFTGGKYHPEIGSHVGDAIEATHLVFHTLDATITQKRIATIIQKNYGLRKKVQ